MTLMLSSCIDTEPQYSRLFGNDIHFGSSSNRGINTKASYSGVLTSGYERIDWSEGDPIRIYCAEASEPSAKYADYTIATGKVTNSGTSSSAKLTKENMAIGLRWGNENLIHHFTALCPTPGTNGIAGTSVAENTVTCVLPATQTCSGTPTAVSGDYTAAVNTQYLYLAGYGTADPKAESTPVNLYFDPAVTTFQFTLTNAYASGNAMTIKSAGITTASGKLVGSYTVNVTGINATTGTLQTSNVGTSGLTDATVTMNFSPVLSIAKDKTLTFTLFTHPGYDITKLTFWMIDNDDVRRSFSFKYVDTSKGTDGWVNFTAFHKIKISGLMTPESAGWTINMIPMIADWNKTDKDTEMEGGISFTTPAVYTWEDEDKGNLSYFD